MSASPAIHVVSLNGYDVYVPTSGGKAGKGMAVSSTFQIRRGDCIKKQIRFSLVDPADRSKAIGKVKAWIRDNPAT